MPIMTTCHRAGTTDTQDLMFDLGFDNEQRAVLAMTQRCFMQWFVMGWKAASGLGVAPDTGEAIHFDGLMSFASVEMQPGLVFSSGPLVMTLRLSSQDAKRLRDDIDRFLAVDSGPKH